MVQYKDINKGLLDQLEDQENTLRNAEVRIANLQDKNTHSYICKRNDPVDNSLSEYINKNADKHKIQIMFIRESPGVYFFGQKRVMIKIGKNGNLLVRIGGGFLGIDEFIDTYTKEELDRLQMKKNVLSKF